MPDSQSDLEVQLKNEQERCVTVGDYQRTPEDDENDRIEREWKQKLIDQARKDFMRRYPDGRVVSKFPGVMPIRTRF